MSLQYHCDNGYLLLNGKEIYKFKASNKNVNFPSQFLAGSISSKFDYVDSEEVPLKGNVYDFLVDYVTVDKYNILNIHQYLKIKNSI